jgi:hypothetical protein
VLAAHLCAQRRFGEVVTPRAPTIEAGNRVDSVRIESWRFEVIAATRTLRELKGAARGSPNARTPSTR